MKISGLLRIIVLLAMLNLSLCAYASDMPVKDAKGGNAVYEKSDVKAYLSSRKAEVLYAIDKGTAFLRERIKNNDFVLSCKSTGDPPCPVHHSGKVFAAFFLTDALKGDLSAQEVDFLNASVLAEKRKDGGWGYAAFGPPDSDDTAFAMRTLRMLGNARPLDPLFAYYIEEQGGFVTFPLRKKARVADKISEANNLEMHPEVNANIFCLFLEGSSQTTVKPNLALIYDSQTADGWFYSYFYPDKYYGTYMALTLFCGFGGQKEAVDKGIRFLKGSQNPDGSWGSPSSPYETALALNAMRSCKTDGMEFAEGISYLLSTQQPDGSWRTESVVWKYLVSDATGVVWNAYDASHAVATSLAVKALKEARQ